MLPLGWSFVEKGSNPFLTFVGKSIGAHGMTCHLVRVLQIKWQLLNKGGFPHCNGMWSLGGNEIGHSFDNIIELIG